MSPPNMGNRLPEKGNIFPEAGYEMAISAALRRNLGDTRRAIKTLVGWTGANERTVKNWLSGVSGPSGVHLIALLRCSDDVFEAILLLTDRQHLVANVRLSEVRQKLMDTLAILDAGGE